MTHNLELQGRFELEIWTPRSQSAGSWNPQDYELIHYTHVRNGITTAGITDMFEQYLRQGSGTTPSLGLIDSDNYTALSSSDTMASHTGWTENVDYSESTRPVWGPDAAAGAAVTNSVKVLFTMTSAVNLRGLFVTSDSTKSGTAGVLWSTALFGIITSVEAGQVARAGYSLSGIGA